MKKLIISASALMMATSFAFAGSQMTNNDKLSYTVGYKTGQQLRTNKTKISSKAFLKGVKDGLDGNKPQLTKSQMQNVLSSYQKQMMAKIKAAASKVATKNLAASTAFMSANAKKSNIKTIEPGLQYKVLTQGNGPKPSTSDTVKVDYEGKLINGQVFDSSYKRGKPVSFKLNQVIPGWRKALTQMPQGSTWMVYISPKLAYGKRGALGAIGPNEALIFKVHLIKVSKS